MSIYGSIIPRGQRAARLAVPLSPTARQRLKWFDYYEAHGQNAVLRHLLSSDR